MVDKELDDQKFDIHLEKLLHYSDALKFIEN